MDVTGDEEGLDEELQLAEDLFKHNPECTELSESLDEARDLLQQGKFDQARVKVTNTIDACRTLIRNVEELPESKRDIQLRQVLIYLSILTVLIIVSYNIYKRVKYFNKTTKK